MAGRWVHTLLSLVIHRSHTSLDRRWPGGQEGAWVGPKMQTGQSQVLASGRVASLLVINPVM